MEAFSICGGRPLSGEIRAYGAKNAVLPPACGVHARKGAVRLSGLPAPCGHCQHAAAAREPGLPHGAARGMDLIVDTDGASEHVMPEALSKQMRSSISCWGPCWRGSAARCLHIPAGAR